jgi:hypothetical protein
LIFCFLAIFFGIIIEPFATFFTIKPISKSSAFATFFISSVAIPLLAELSWYPFFILGFKTINDLKVRNISIIYNII